MAVNLTTPNTLLGALAPKSETARLASVLGTVVLGSVLLTICSKISIPVQPVPVNLQTMAVALLAAAFGWRIGVATVALFIVEGLAGLPVFTFGGGAQYIFSPTFGFIIGFLPMAYIIGRAADTGASRKVILLFGAMIAGDAVAFVCGYGWLVAMSGSASWIDQTNVLGSAFGKAVQPFIIWDIVKMAFAAISATALWELMGKDA